LPPLMMKLAMTVSPYPTFPRMREKGQTNRCASFKDFKSWPVAGRAYPVSPVILLTY